MSKKPFVAIGVDPGTGLKSPTGLAVIDPVKRELLYVQTIGSKQDITIHRIKDIADEFRDVIERIALQHSCVVYVEKFVMRGAGGETLARMTGALLSAIPYDCEVEFIQNTTLKKLVGGSGKADKLQVAEGCMKWLQKEDAPEIQKLIDAENWDGLDAIGLAIAGTMRSEIEDA